MLSLFLAIVCSAAIAIILKVNESRGGDRFVMSGTNYAVAAILGLLLPLGSDGATGWGTIAYGVFVGCAFVGGFLLLMLGINRLGLAIPASVSRLSMLVPSIASLFVFDERLEGMAVAGIGIGALSFFLLGAAQRGSSSREQVDATAVGLIAAIFLVSGCTDFSLKVAQHMKLAEGPFLAVVYGTSALLCLALAIAKRRRVEARDLALGTILGVPNFFSGYFILLALREVPASVAFPALSAGVVVMVTVTAVLFWRERLRGAAWAGIALAAIAVALLGAD